ncbi:putative inositol monophosphatase protein [Phaeoacremonium minimum UCRPA7]|uniref:Inositol-1-monophosphatase n=1 Tax=Phaeoacremonium minimum (strain UCR-PA7) TaxID=1286976 RepID=R8BAV9_PHAM7|nr:putative inositol monophosphatase protein [Phaeoacremonium minimum UCRPA7]EON96424.1 putative inositol monophosphatase protein [Phaeoacremonium minimum UCRPA7]
MAEVNLQEIHDTLLSIAFEAGRMIMAANPDDISTGTKLNSVDIVTETDQAVEKMVSTRLQNKYPTFSFVGEETYVAGETKVTDAPTFIVDPIDGTTNFVHGFPNACISLGFAVNRIPAVGVVYNPFQDLLFTGIQGHGSFVQRNASLPAPGEKRRLGPKTPLGDLSTALVAVEWGSERDGPNFDIRADVFRKLTASKKTGGSMVHSLRSLGSAALNLCAVAAGQCDMYWEGGCYAWDVCAGWAILREAGGIMASGNPGDWDPAIDSRVYLAVRGAPSGQKELVEELWAVIGDSKMSYKH